MSEFKPRILVFSTDNVSDPGIDLVALWFAGLK